MLGPFAQVLEALFAFGQQIKKRAKKYPAEYKPKNEEGNNQDAESSPIRWNMHSTASPPRAGLKVSHPNSKWWRAETPEAIAKTAGVSENQVRPAWPGAPPSPWGRRSLCDRRALRPA